MQYNKVEICGVNTGKLKVLKEKEKKEIAKSMKEKKYSIEEIMQITELTKEEIEKL